MLYAHLMYFSLFLIFLVIHVFSVCELSYISNIYIKCLETSSNLAVYLGSVI